MSVKYDFTLNGLVSAAIRMIEMTQHYQIAYCVMFDGDQLELAPVMSSKGFVPLAMNVVQAFSVTGHFASRQDAEDSVHDLFVSMKFLHQDFHENRRQNLELFADNLWRFDVFKPENGRVNWTNQRMAAHDTYELIVKIARDHAPDLLNSEAIVLAERFVAENWNKHKSLTFPKVA